MPLTLANRRQYRSRVTTRVPGRAGNPDVFTAFTLRVIFAAFAFGILFYALVEPQQ